MTGQDKRKQTLDEIVHLIKYNGGRVAIQPLIRNLMLLHGLKEETIVSYLKLLEITGQTKIVYFFYLEVTDKTGIRERPKVEKNEEIDDDPESANLLERLTEHSK